MAADEMDLERRWRLVLPHRERALRVASARVGNLLDAEDIAQEALIRAVSVDELREDSVGGLISTITARLCVDHHRRSTTTRTALSRLHGSEATDDPALETFLDQHEARWLFSAATSLRPLEREVLLRRAAGQGNATTAEALATSYAAVASAYTRARNTMKLIWRSTLGVLAGLLLGFRELTRRWRQVGPSTSLAMAALVIAVLHLPITKPLELPDRPATRTSAVADVESEAAAAVASVGGARLSRASPAPQLSEAVKSDARRVVIDTGRVGDPRLVDGGVRVVTRHEDEAPLETLALDTSGLALSNAVQRRWVVPI